jgi:hypothetical protein
VDDQYGSLGPWDYPRDNCLKFSHVALRGDTPLVWTVDLDRNLLFYDRDGQNLTYDFSVPEPGPLQLRHFRPYTCMMLSQYRCKQSTMVCSSAAAPRDVVSESLYNLVYRMATDYEHNWRSSGLTVQRHGLHHLAMGILSCFTLNFEVRKVVGINLHLHPYMNSVSANSLIRWRTWSSPQVVTTVCLGALQIIFTEWMDLATSLVHEHFASKVLNDLDRFRYGNSPLRHTTDSTEPSYGYNPFHVKVHYIVTSIREIQYFTKTYSKGETTMTCAPIEPFFYDSGLPSKIGVRLLLNAIHQQTYPLHTHIHSLPIEIQELIIDYACPSQTHNMFERAVFAAKLSIGVPFSFTSQNHPIVLRDLKRGRELHPEEPEYHVLFWDTYAGLVYQVDKGSSMEKVNPRNLWSLKHVKWFGKLKLDSRW